MHHQSEKQQGAGPYVQLAALARIAVQQPQRHANHHHQQTDPHASAAQPQAPSHGQGAGNDGDHRPAKQTGHAKHNRAGVKNHARHQDQGHQHAHHADAAEQHARNDLPDQGLLPPEPDVDAVQKAQRQQQCNAFDQFKEHGLRAGWDISPSSGGSHIL